MPPEQLSIAALLIMNIATAMTSRFGHPLRIYSLPVAEPIVDQRRVALAAPRGVKAPSPQDKVLRDE